MGNKQSKTVSSEAENIRRLLDANEKENKNVDFSEIPYSEKENTDEADAPPDCDNDEIHEIADHLVTNKGKIYKICDAIEECSETFEPSNREEIIIDVEQIAKKIENMELGTFVARAGGAVLGVGGAVVGIVGGTLLIIGTGGIAATIVLPAVAIGVGSAGGVASVGGSLTNGIYKSTQFKKVEKLTENDRAYYGFIQEKVDELKKLIEENESIAYKLLKKLITSSSSSTESWVDWMKRMWEKVVNRIKLTVSKIPTLSGLMTSLQAMFTVVRTATNSAINIIGRMAPVVDDVLGNGGRVALIGARAVGSITIVFSAVSIVFDTYTLLSGIHGLVKNKDVKAIRGIADSMRKLSIMEYGYYTMGESRFYTVYREEEEKEEKKNKKEDEKKKEEKEEEKRKQEEKTDGEPIETTDEKVTDEDEEEVDEKRMIRELILGLEQRYQLRPG